MIKNMKIKDKFTKCLAVLLTVALVFTSNNLAIFAEETNGTDFTTGIYGDFYVTNADGQPVQDGNGVSYDETSGILMVTTSGCKVTMKFGVTTTADRIVFNCGGSASGHTYIIIENVTINTTKGIALENKQRYADEFIAGDCVLIGTTGVKVDVDGGNMFVGLDTKSASLLMQGTSDYGFNCNSTIGFGNNGNSVTIIGDNCAVNVANTAYLNTQYSNMKAGIDADSLSPVTGFSSVNNISSYKYVTILPDSSYYAKVTYNANGGTGSISDNTVLSSQDFTIPSCTFTKEGSLFNCWTDGAGNEYKPGDVIKVTADLVLSATWKDIITSVSVTSSEQSVIKGNTVSFSASVVGENEPAQTVTWSIVEAHSTGTTISDEGLLTVADDESATELTVKATSTLDTAKSGTSTVTLVNPTYTINADNVSKDFGSLDAGYIGQPTQETITITNDGNSAITLTQPTATYYNVGNLSATTLVAGATAFFTIQPKAGLSAGNYSESITVVTDHSTSATIGATFRVNGEFSATITPDSAAILTGTSQVLEAMPEGGSGNYTYKWFAGDSETAFSTEKSVTVSLTETTTYKVVVNDAIEDTTVTATVTVNATTPIGLTPVKPSDVGATDGKITGTTAQMEYSTTTEFTPETTTACTGTEITGLSAGTYYVRVKATSGVGASAYLEVSIPDGEHTYSTEWSHDATHHWHAAICSHTELNADVAEHTFTNYIYNNDATYFADGTETGSCICGATDTRIATGTKLIDNVSPNATVTVKTRSWTNILYVITFSNFFKETQEIQITALDNESGLDMVQYYVSTTPLTEDEVKAIASDSWKTYNNNSRPELTMGKFYVYAKVTDKVGNKTYVGTDGIIIYQDSTQNTTQIGFIKNVSDDVKAEVELNGNTIDGIRLGNDLHLTENTDYTVDNATGMITFKKSYLNTLAPDSYTLTIAYKPQGEAYQSNESGGSDKNEAPTTTTIALMVRLPKLSSITAPDPIIGLLNGKDKTAQALMLPDKVTISTEDSNITEANVIWNLDTLASGSYDPNVLTQQAFTLNGDVQLPSSIDADGKSLTTTIQVTVNAAGTVGVPTANPQADTYTTNQNVELTTATEGADIYYTTDGSTPSRTNGNKYDGKIAVTGTEGQEDVITIKAIAVKEKMQDSEVATFAYIIKLPIVTIAPTISTESKDVTILVGETATFTIVATGTPEPTSQWQVDRNDGEGFVNIAGATGASYTTSQADMSFNGFKYRCVVTNAAGSVISTVVNLTVNTEKGNEPDYGITTGVGGTHFIGTDETLTITCSGALDKLIGIYVDDVLQDASNYTLKSGSTILTLNSDYLNKLSLGTHKLKFVYTDDSVETTFIVKDTNTGNGNDKPMDTGDNTPIVWLFIVAIASGTVALYLGLKKKFNK